MQDPKFPWVDAQIKIFIQGLQEKLLTNCQPGKPILYTPGGGGGGGKGKKNK